MVDERLINQALKKAMKLKATRVDGPPVRLWKQGAIWEHICQVMSATRLDDQYTGSVGTMVISEEADQDLGND
jgi:hypothetical protein